MFLILHISLVSTMHSHHTYRFQFFIKIIHMPYIWTWKRNTISLSNTQVFLKYLLWVNLLGTQDFLLLKCSLSWKELWELDTGLTFSTQLCFPSLPPPFHCSQICVSYQESTKLPCTSKFLQSCIQTLDRRKWRKEKCMLVAVSVKCPPWIALGVYGKWPSHISRRSKESLTWRKEGFSLKGLTVVTLLHQSCIVPQSFFTISEWSGMSWKSHVQMQARGGHFVFKQKATRIFFDYKKKYNIYYFLLL